MQKYKDLVDEIKKELTHIKTVVEKNIALVESVEKELKSLNAPTYFTDFNIYSFGWCNEFSSFMLLNEGTPSSKLKESGLMGKYYFDKYLEEYLEEYLKFLRDKK